MEEKILTISVAAYNLEKLIEDNLKSFVECKERELLEVIVTDDGSKDCTAEIIEKYQTKYPRVIKLIKKKNEGAGSTVNSGIRNATGKYFKMIDGDDWVEPIELDKLIEKLKKEDADMIITNYKTYNEETKKIVDKVKYNIEEGKEISIKDIYMDNQVRMHNVLYKTNILKENNIVLDNGFYTDMEYLLLPIPYVKKVVYYDLDIYVYRIAREGQSVSLSSMQKHIDMHGLVLDRLLRYYEENKKLMNEDNANYMLRKVAEMADTQLATLLTFKINKEQKEVIKDFIKYIKEYNDIYEIFRRKKKEQLLIKSNFLLTKLVSRLVLKKIYNQ